MSATPTPWSLQKCNNGGALLIRGEGAGQHPQFSIQIVPLEDAELIVRAVNSHAALLEAGQRALHHMLFRGWAIQQDHELRDVYAQLKAAIAKATGLKAAEETKNDR